MIINAEPLFTGAHLHSKCPVNIGKGFQVALGMPHWRSCVGLRCITEVARARAQHLRGLIGPFQPQRVGFLLAPLQSTLVAINAQPERILLTDADLAGS